MNIIYNNEFNQADFIATINDIMECNEIDFLTEDQKLNLYYDYLNDWLDNEKYNLDIPLDNNIIAIADLGFWNGRKQGYKILGNNIKDIINSFNCDTFKIYVENKNVKFIGWHHDGTHYITFREIKNPDNIDNFLNKLYAGETITNNMLNYYTRSLYSDVKKVYGF